MKVIIAHASAGSGHLKAAEAICGYFEEHRPDIDPEIIDVLKVASPFYKSTYAQAYAWLVKHTPGIWNFCFWTTHAKLLRFIFLPFEARINRLNSRDFINYLETVNPEYVICTHFLPSGIAVYLKSKGRIRSKVITVVTDYGVHAFWFSKGVDLFVVGSLLTKQQLVNEGLDANRIEAFGIPVNKKFLVNFNKPALRKKLRLSNDKFTVLISTGSFGMGPIEEILDLLPADIQVLVICANNKELYQRLKVKNYPNLFLFGFVNNIQELMAVSDCIIAKPGGLTIAEGLVMELFPIFAMAIPGQEMENAKQLAESGVGLYATDSSVIVKAVLDFKDHPEKLAKAKEAIRKIKKPNALEEISRVIR